MENSHYLSWQRPSHLKRSIMLSGSQGNGLEDKYQKKKKQKNEDINSKGHLKALGLGKRDCRLSPGVLCVAIAWM